MGQKDRKCCIIVGGLQTCPGVAASILAKESSAAIG